MQDTTYIGIGGGGGSSQVSQPVQARIVATPGIGDIPERVEVLTGPASSLPPAAPGIEWYRRNRARWLKQGLRVGGAPRSDLTTGPGVGDCLPGAGPACTDLFGGDAPMKARMISRPGTRMRQGFYLGAGSTVVVGKVERGGDVETAPGVGARLGGRRGRRRGGRRRLPSSASPKRAARPKRAPIERAAFAEVPQWVEEHGGSKQPRVAQFLALSTTAKAGAWVFVETDMNLPEIESAVVGNRAVDVERISSHRFKVRMPAWAPALSGTKSYEMMRIRLFDGVLYDIWVQPKGDRVWVPKLEAHAGKFGGVGQ